MARGYVGQSGIDFVTRPYERPYSAPRGKIIGKVVQVNDGDNSAKVVLLNGVVLDKVQYLSGHASTKYGMVHQVASDPVDASMYTDTPIGGGKQDAYVLVDFIEGDVTQPVILGGLYPENAEVLGLPAYYYHRVKGGHYDMVDSLEGGYERVFPDTSYFRAYAGNFGRTMLNNPDETYQHIGGPAFGFYFYHMPTANVIFHHRPTGEIEMLWNKAVSIQLGMQSGPVSIEVGPSGADLGGDYTFLEKPVCPSDAGADADRIATIGDVRDLIDQYGGEGFGGGGGGVSGGTGVYWGDLDWTDDNPLKLEEYVPTEVATGVAAGIADHEALYTHRADWEAWHAALSDEADLHVPKKHTHTKGDISDLETIQTTPAASCVPKADGAGKIAAGWLSGHDVISYHTYSGGAALDLVGLTAASTLGMITPSSNPGANSKILKSDASGNLQVQGLGASVTPVAGVVAASGDVTVGDQLNLNVNVIKATITKTGISDNVATEIFKITTTNESGSTDGGGWVCHVKGLVGHAVSSGTGEAAVKYFAAHFARAMSGAGSGGLSAVTKEDDDCLISTGLTRSIGTVTLTTAESTEYDVRASITIDLTGSGISTGQVSFEVTLMWYGFLTAPVIAAV